MHSDSCDVPGGPVKLSWETFELRTTHAFSIARQKAPPVRRAAWVRIADDTGVEGWGEAAPNVYYGETAETVEAVLTRYEPALNDAAAGDPFALERIERAVELAVGRNPAARVAVSAALHDLIGKRLGVPVWKLWGLSPETTPDSSFTLGLTTPAQLREWVRDAAAYPILKLKVGSPGDEELLRVVREEAPDARIRIDANTGWSLKSAVARLPLLHELDIELIEQPFKADDVEAFRVLRAQSPIPIIADESCRTVADIPRLLGAVDGINIKLEKCGSLREAVRMVHVARAHGMQVMLGCMVTSTLGIAAAAQVAPLVDYVDLDGAALLAEDPFAGPGMTKDGKMRLNDEPGFGVTRRNA